jgi:hypothetical protein
MQEVLPPGTPGMEHAGAPNVRSEVLGIASKFEQRSGAGAAEQIIEQPLVLAMRAESSCATVKTNEGGVTE